jgi:hypothetical protein
MFRLNIAMNGVQWPLLFKDKEKVDEAWTLASSFKPDMSISLEDDFGQKFAAPCIMISGVMLEDLDQTKIAHIELSLHHARMQGAAQKAAAADPAIRETMRPQQPSVFVPGGMNGRGM